MTAINITPPNATCGQNAAPSLKLSSGPLNSNVTAKPITPKINQKPASQRAFSLDFFFLGDKARQEMNLLKEKL